MGILIFTLAVLFLLVMLASCIVTLSLMYKNRVITRWNARRPKVTDIIEGEVVEETRYLELRSKN